MSRNTSATTQAQLRHHAGGCLLSDGLTKKTTVVGSDSNCDLVVVGEGIAARHVKIRRLKGQYTVESLADAPTLLNGHPVRDVQALADGDELRLGTTRLSFVAASPPDTLDWDHWASELQRSPDPEPGNSDDRLTMVYEIARALDQGDEPVRVLERLSEMIFTLFRPSRVLLSEVSSDTRVAQNRIVRVADQFRSRGSSFSSTILAKLIEDKQPFVTADAIADDALANARSVLVQQIRSAIGIPIMNGEAVIGVLYVDNLGSSRPFNSADFRFLVAISRLAAVALKNARQRQRLRSSNRELQSRFFPGLVGQSAAMKQVFQQIEAYAQYAQRGKGSVLIRGASGTGKEMVARALHAKSPRRDGPFVSVNCAAIPEHLIESELFGYDKGAFTGAVKKTLGKFALANGGTLFLDEIADMSLVTQAKVLRAVEYGEFTLLGSESTETTDCWILSATNKDLKAEIEAGRFREDLFYRLGVLPIELPTLSERTDDLPLLVESFLADFTRETARAFSGVAPAAINALLSYPWPGNIRELKNEIERAAILARGERIELADLSPRVSGTSAVPPIARDQPPAAETLVEDFAQLANRERELLVMALQLNRGNAVKTARMLGLTRAKFNTRVTRFDLEDTIQSIKAATRAEE